MEASDTTPSIDEREAELAARERAILEKEAQLTSDEQAAADRDKAARERINVDHAPETPEEVQALASAFAEYRKEVAALRNELAAHRKRPAVSHIPDETPEQRANAHLELIAEHSHYCPGCGRLGKYAQACEGQPTGPHARIEMVSTDELGGDPANHTAAPSTDPDQLAA